jgi:hypothetical protein
MAETTDWRTGAVWWFDTDWDRVREARDRSLTRRLLALLGHLTSAGHRSGGGEGEDDPQGEDHEEIENDEDVVDSICNTLAQITDPRSIAPLLAMAEHSGREHRQYVVHALGAAGWIEAETAHRWYTDGDPELQGYAVRHLWQPDQEVLRSILADPTHIWFANAVDALNFGFEEPHWQQIKSAALTHPNPDVRRTAASTVLWDEPLIAVDGLLAGLDDPDPHVAHECIDVLQYYPSPRVLLELNRRALETPNEEQRAHIMKTVDSIRETYEGCLDDLVGEVRQRFLRWAAPVRHLLREIPEVPANLGREAAFTSLKTPRTITSWSPDLAARVADADGQWTETFHLLRHLDVSPLEPHDRHAILSMLSTHPDVEVRELSARLAAVADDEALVLNLLSDPLRSVRKSAAYCAHDLSASDEIASVVIAPVLRGEEAGTAAHEAIRTWARHVERLRPADLVPQLNDLVADTRESVRCEAIEQLAIRNERDAIGACLHLLDEPPLVSWSVHGTLLDAARRLGLTVPDETIASLRASSDHPWLQAILAAWPDTETPT